MISKTIYIPISILFLCFIISCAPQRVEMPLFDVPDLNMHLAELSKFQTIEAVLFLEYEKGDSFMNGDASLTVSENAVDLKVYYLGFLAGYILENNGVVNISQKIDRNKSVMLVEGLKNSFLWWKIKDYTIDEVGEFYKLQNYNRKIFIDKKTLLPVQQFIELYNGDELRIFYDSPAKMENAGEKVQSRSLAAMWYQSKLKIFLNKHLLKIKISSYIMSPQ